MTIQQSTPIVLTPTLRPNHHRPSYSNYYYCISDVPSISDMQHDSHHEETTTHLALVSELIQLEWPSLQERQSFARLTMLLTIENNLIYYRQIPTRFHPASIVTKVSSSSRFSIGQCTNSPSFHEPLRNGTHCLKTL